MLPVVVAGVLCAAFSAVGVIFGAFFGCVADGRNKFLFTPVTFIDIFLCVCVCVRFKIDGCGVISRHIWNNFTARGRYISTPILKRKILLMIKNHRRDSAFNGPTTTNTVPIFNFSNFLLSFI